MAADIANIRQHIRNFDFRTLFIEELGWDNLRTPITVEADDRDWSLTPIAEKRGFQVFRCPPDANGEIPERAVRQQIDNRLAKTVLEHLIVYTDESNTGQRWQWALRQPEKPVIYREERFDKAGSESGERLAQKLQHLFVSIDEDERLTVVDVSGRAKQAFRRDKVTKKFYERFDKERKAFLPEISGIPDLENRDWYASIMLNRLMFVYFVQAKGFLNNDRQYLRTKLREVQRERGADQFYTFYREFLLKLFHQGLGAQKPRPADIDALLGDVPYLNGGIFEQHTIEQANPDIQIPDTVFERIFEFFDAYDWHLDDRPLQDDTQINPDVLGYIFEKYINQKQMGAYYTKEDITEYISKNTIVPFLFDAAKPLCSIAFKPGSAMWGLLADNPDRYIYDAVSKGTDLPLPDDIAAGISDVPKRNIIWNKPAADAYALPTETWREHVARRTHYEEIWNKLVDGKVSSIDDLITYNLDIRQFAQDVIQHSEGPELVRAFFEAIQQVSVLDPTCGSGAFLFAALNILHPLYDACLERMEEFVRAADADEQASPQKYSDFRKTLAEVATHGNRDYYIFKTIIVRNLYGVDIMEEAVEICKLRLFLKLASQLEEGQPIEPLPDIDFNIRAGNTLVGFASMDEVRKAFLMDARDNQRLPLPDDIATLARIEERAELADRAYQLFRDAQTEPDHAITADHKQQLRARLSDLSAELDTYLARLYGIDNPQSDKFAAWQASHQPFHWLVDFYGIVSSGGFDVVIGNPPYIVYSPSRIGYSILESDYDTFAAKNLYAYVFERSMQISNSRSMIGLIIQLTAMSSEKMPSLQDAWSERCHAYMIPFPRRPESIFEGVEMPVLIVLARHSNYRRFTTSRVRRFYAEERPNALNVSALKSHPIRIDGYRIAKIGSTIEEDVIQKMTEHEQFRIESLVQRSSTHMLYYQEACRYWVKANYGPPFFRRNGVAIEPPHGRKLGFQSRSAAELAACVANSSLFYWYYSVFSDCEHINDGLVRGFPIPKSLTEEDWDVLYHRLDESLTTHATRKMISTSQGHKIEYDELKASKSKPIIDEIDRVLARHYGFTEEELDFIVNYDIKYRMGRDAAGGDGG